MSLINDALKRAKESHGQHSPPPPGGPLRPVEPAPRPGTPAWVWLVVIILLVGIGAFLIGQGMRKNGENKTSEPVAVKSPVSQPVKVESVKPQQPATSVSEPPPVKPVELLQNETPSNPTPTIVEPVVPKPVPLKLQSIIYDPRRPSVMINGKSLFVGDRIGEWQVIKIQRNSATLAGAGQTNVLELEN